MKSILKVAVYQDWPRMFVMHYLLLPYCVFRFTLHAQSFLIISHLKYNSEYCLLPILNYWQGWEIITIPHTLYVPV